MLLTVHRRWLLFQAVAFAIAAGCLATTWDAGQPVHAQPWIGPLFIALTPLMVRSAFLRGDARRWSVPGALIVGMTLVQLINIALAVTSQMPWRAALTVIVAAALIEVAIGIITVVRRRYAR